MSLLFLLNSALLGVGLAMDAFSVSIAHGLSDSDMKKSRALEIAGTFGGFQALMPMLGYICLRTVAKLFYSFNRYIPWIAFILLAYIGGRMCFEGLRKDKDLSEKSLLERSSLLVQGVATSIDAFSAGVAFVQYDYLMAVCASVIIAAVTFGICLCGVLIGKRIGLQFAKHAQIVGGIILILIGLEILLT